MHLEGITVLALEQAVAAPYASGRLAEEGARVIKVERPEGDFAREYDRTVKNQSAYFVWLNAGKESVALNLRAANDKKLFTNMLRRSDVFIQNLSPGAISRLGIELSELRDQNPGLITCSINGYGEHGPFKEQKAYDLLIQAESGICSVTGIGDQLTRVGVSVSDISAGMNAYQEILLALYKREKDPKKKGTDISVSLFHSSADWMNVPYLQYVYGGELPKNPGLEHPTIAPYGSFTTLENEQVLISVQNQGEWETFCDQVLKKPRLKTRRMFLKNIDRVKNRAHLNKIIDGIFASTSEKELMKRLNSAGIAFGKINDVAALSKHPQARFRRVKIQKDQISMLGRGAQKEMTKEKILQIPKLNEHGKILREEFSS
jgi:crotonobetainyl-CoA:carnitine CoA-transferase CaiB-like acyl-CoA transferase